MTGEERKEAFKKHFKASERIGRGVLDVWQWPELEVKLFLKNRKRTISLHCFYDFQTIPKAENFSYEVLLGDPEKIKADLLEGEAMEKAEAF